MLIFDFTNQFKKDLKLLKKRGKNMDKIMDVMVSLIWEEPLPARCREHILSGNYAGIRRGTIIIRPNLRASVPLCELFFSRKAAEIK